MNMRGLHNHYKEEENVGFKKIKANRNKLLNVICAYLWG